MQKSRKITSSTSSTSTRPSAAQRRAASRSSSAISSLLVRLERAPERFDGLLQCSTMPLARHDGRLARAKASPRMPPKQ
jgi:hypothetical protein